MLSMRGIAPPSPSSFGCGAAAVLPPHHGVAETPARTARAHHGVAQSAGVSWSGLTAELAIRDIVCGSGARVGGSEHGR